MLEKFRWRRKGGHLAFGQSMVLVPLGLSKKKEEEESLLQKKKPRFENSSKLLPCLCLS